MQPPVLAIIAHTAILLEICTPHNPYLDGRLLMWMLFTFNGVWILHGITIRVLSTCLYCTSELFLEICILPVIYSLLVEFMIWILKTQGGHILHGVTYGSKLCVLSITFRYS